MSRLVAIIDAYKDRHGQPSDSSIARAIGVKPQTVSSWRKRGIKEPPDRDALRQLARLAQVDYENVVLRAALLDSGWIDEQEEGEAHADRSAAPTSQPASGPDSQSGPPTDGLNREDDDRTDEGVDSPRRGRRGAR